VGILCATVLIAAAWEARSLYATYLEQGRPPLWDMAGHGWGGVELMRSLSSGDVLGFLDRLNRQDTWPFGFSLLLLPFLALGHSSFAAATLLSTVLFVLVPLLLVWAAWEVDPRGWSGGLLAAVLFLAAPLHRLFAVLVMRETAGIAFSLLALILYLRARRLGTERAWRAAGLAALALFLIKYNYALIWGLTVAACEWRSFRFPRSRKARLLGAGLGLLAVLVAAGVSVGGLLYAGLVIATVWLAVRWRRDREAVRTWWRSRTVPVRALLATVVIPLWIWCLSPAPIHPRNILAFLRNRSAGPPLFSLDSLLYYPRSLLHDFAALPAVGWGVLLLALVGLVVARGPGRVLAWAVGIGWLLPVLHPYKEPRFLATVVPLTFLLAALAPQLLRKKGGWGPRAIQLLAAGGIAYVAFRSGDLDRRLVADYALYSAPPAFWKPLDSLAESSQGAANVAVLGTFNELSESLVRWRLALGERTRRTEVVGSLRKGERLEKWLREERPERVLAIRVLPRSPYFENLDYRLHRSWQLAAIDELAKTGGWEAGERRRYRQLGLEMVSFRPVAPAPPGSP
jgi:hypothetical protein